MDYSKAVKKLKKSLGLSDKELGKMLGVSSNSVWHWTSGRTTPTGAKKITVDQELLKNKIVSQEELNSNGAAEPKKEPTKRGRKPGKKVGKKSGKPSVKTTVAAVSADRNLLKTFYTQLAAEKKIKSFQMEIQGINKKHVKDLSPEQWAEIMTLFSDL